MSFTKTNLEILDIEKLVDLKTNHNKSQQLISNNQTENSRTQEEFILKINMIDANTLASYSLEDKNIAPKFKYLYAHDDYHFGTTEHFINNCDLKNLNKITTINNGWNDEWNDLYQFDIIVSSIQENVFFEKVQMSLKNLDENEKTDIKEYFQKTYNFKRDTSFIKWVLLSWKNKK